jgi:hypothetical protein
MREEQSPRLSRDGEHDRRLTGRPAAVFLLEHARPRPNRLTLPPNPRRRPVPRIKTNQRSSKSFGNHEPNQYQPNA